MHALLRRYPIISDQMTLQELQVIIRELERILEKSVNGDIVELGCFIGTASLFIQRILRAEATNRKFHVYDSFEGLPPKQLVDQSPAGEQFKAGELLARKQDFIKNFKQAGLPLPRIHKSWFNKLMPSDLPDHVAWAFLDGDFYQSIIDSLQLVWPKLSSGAVVIVDDYQAEALPGARRAVDEWLRNHPATLRVEASLAIIHRQD